MRTLKGLLVSLLLATSAAVAVNPDGLTFKSADGRMSVWLPAMPQAIDQPIPSQTGGPYRRVTYSVESSTSLLLAGVLDFRENLSTSGDEASYLDTMLGSMTEGFGGQFAIDKEGGIHDLVLAGSNLKGRQVQGTVHGQRIVLRAYVGKHSIYMLQAGFPTSNPAAAATAHRFLESLLIAE